MFRFESYVSRGLIEDFEDGYWQVEWRDGSQSSLARAGRSPSIGDELQAVWIGQNSDWRPLRIENLTQGTESMVWDTWLHFSGGHQFFLLVAVSVTTVMLPLAGLFSGQLDAPTAALAHTSILASIAVWVLWFVWWGWRSFALRKELSASL